MVVRLDTLPRKFGALALALSASVGVSYGLGRAVRVEQLFREGTPASLERAVAIEPQNPRLHHQLGRVLLYSPESDSRLAEAHLQRAAALGPWSGDHWTDLALAREMRGDVPGARDALTRAQQAEPRTPLILWQVMNFHLRRGETQQALAEAAVLLRAAPDYTSRVVPVLAGAVPMEKLIASAVPDDPRVLCDLLMVISRARDHSGAALAWEHVLRSGGDFRSVCVSHFLDALINAGEAPLAERVWRDSIQRGWFNVEPSALQEPFYNSDFRHPLLNFGFDWRVLPHAEASTWIEAQGPEPGQQSLCVEFSPDARQEYSHIQRYLPAQPDTEYLFRGFIRSDRLVSGSGAYLQIMEVSSPKAPAANPVYARSESWSGTTRWTEMAFRVKTGPQTQLLMLQLRRPAAVANEPAASGQTCLSAVEWRALGPAKTTVAQAASAKNHGGAP